MRPLREIETAFLLLLRIAAEIGESCGGKTRKAVASPPSGHANVVDARRLLMSAM